MGTRLLVQDGAFPHIGFIGGDSAFVTQEWRCLGPESVNDNVPDGHVEMARIGASVPGGGPERCAPE